MYIRMYVCTYVRAYVRTYVTLRDVTLSHVKLCYATLLYVTLRCVTSRYVTLYFRFQFERPFRRWRRPTHNYQLNSQTKSQIEIRLSTTNKKTQPNINNETAKLSHEFKETENVTVGPLQWGVARYFFFRSKSKRRGGSQSGAPV